MTLSSIGGKQAAAIQSLVDLRNTLNDLQRQLSTGKKADTYAGLGLNRGVTVSLNSQLSAIGGYDATANSVMTRISVANTTLSRMSDIASSTKAAMLQGTYGVGAVGAAASQSAARLSLDELVSLLNTRAGDRYLFSGRATDTPAVETSDHIVNGDGARAGLKQIISERQQADLGASGLGRLVVPTPQNSPASLVGTGATLTPDAAAVTHGSADISGLTSAGGTLVINGTSVTINPGDDATAVLAAINAPATVSATGVTASLDTNNKLVLTSADSSTSVDVGAGSSAGLLTELGLSAGTSNPTNLLTQGAVNPGDTMTFAVGTNPALTVTFGTGVGQVSSMAQLNAQLATLVGGTASVNPTTGAISVAATSGTDSITVGGSATPATFGLAGTNAQPGRTNVVRVSEDAAGSPFGFKLASITSMLTTGTVSGPTGSPPSVSVDLSAGNPSPGDTITMRFTLPDGSTENLNLTAATSSPPGDGAFTIGADSDATAANLQAAMTTSIGKLASTSLTAASAVQASNEFFSADANTPPPRVDGPPFDSATAMTTGTSANTVIWYTGEAGTDSARGTATAQIDPSLSVSYGMRANEDGLRTIIQSVATEAAVTISSTDPNAADLNTALNQRLGGALSGSPGTQNITDIETEIANAQVSSNAAITRHTQQNATLNDYLDQIQGVSTEQVGAEILTLQTRLQASMQVTAMMYQTSLVNYMPQ